MAEASTKPATWSSACLPEVFDETAVARLLAALGFDVTGEIRVTVGPYGDLAAVAVDVVVALMLAPC